MLTFTSFDKNLDLGKVIPDLYTDIEDLIVNHKISDTTANVVYNELSDIKSIGVRVNDDFDAIVISRALHSAGLVSNYGTGSSQPAGTSAPVSVSE